jgi:SAM-dependent methyltransferase
MTDAELPLDQASSIGAYGESQHYDAKYFAWQNKHADIKARLKVERIAPYVRPCDTVIDFGSAGGEMLAGLPGSRKIGIEVSDVARAASQRKFGLELYKRIDDVPDGVADTIVTNHTLEHLASPHEALRLLIPKFKPGGKLVVVVPIEGWQSPASRAWKAGDVNRHLYTWTPMNMGNLLHDAGYDPLEIRVVHRALMRHFDKFARLPTPVFVSLQWAWAFVRHQHELIAVAHPRPFGP